MLRLPHYSGTERTTTVIIGTGLPGLAVASELHRRGVKSITVDGLDIQGTGQSTATASLPRCGAADATSRQERSEILRHLRNYATSHHLDIRRTTQAVQFIMVSGGTANSPHRKWAVRTPTGVLLTDNIVLTRCTYSQLRRMLAEFGMTVGQNLVAAMRGIGIYLLGVGEPITPTPKEILRQAKTTGSAISARVYPDRIPSVLTGRFAALPAPA